MNEEKIQGLIKLLGLTSEEQVDALREFINEQVLRDTQTIAELTHKLQDEETEAQQDLAALRAKNAQLEKRVKELEEGMRQIIDDCETANRITGFHEYNYKCLLQDVRSIVLKLYLETPPPAEAEEDA